jgi:hypothetical protein
MNKMISGFIGMALMFMSCTSRDTNVSKDNLNGFDYRLFQGTPSWILAKEVEDEDTSRIISIISKNKDLLESREPKFGQTLLQLAVKTLKFESVKTLVSLGADPNIQDKYDGSSPLMEAAGMLLDDSYRYESNPKYLKLLLEHGGDPNAEEKGVRRQDNNTRYTPLLRACGGGYLEYVKLLVSAGANVNYNNEYGMNPLGEAVISGLNPDIVLYLIEKGADYRRPVYPSFQGAKARYITDWLRYWRYDLGSDLYKKKMQIVAFLKDHGMDYRKTEIPKDYFDQYPKEYLEKY